MLYTGKLLYVELYDTMGKARTNVKKVWESRHGRHPGRCIVTNAHWFDPGPSQCGNYKVDGKELSNQWPDALTGFGWNGAEMPGWTNDMDAVDNFVCTIPALISGKRQNLDYGSGVERATTRTWFGRGADGKWSVEVTTANYTLDGIVDRMAALGITDGMVFDGSGSSQWYDGETHITGDGRTIYSYLLLWFEDDKKEDDTVSNINIIDAGLKFNGTLEKRAITDMIILHHAAGDGSVEAVHNYHLSKGWKGIAYNYYVRKDGTIYIGRPEYAVGGHTSGYNSRSIGICAEGNFESETMSDAQREALRALVLDIRSRYPDTRTVRHRDVAATACPGANYPYDYIAAAAPDPDDTPVEPDKPATGSDTEMTYEEEKAAATEWAKIKDISDGSRPYDPVQRVELWVTLWRLLGGEK